MWRAFTTGNLAQSSENFSPQPVAASLAKSTQSCRSWKPAILALVKPQHLQNMTGKLYKIEM